MDIKFWRIPRELDTVVDQRAKEAASKDDVKNYSELWDFLFEKSLQCFAGQIPNELMSSHSELHMEEGKGSEDEG